MEFKQIKEAIEKTGKAFEEYKTTNDERLKAIADGNETKAAELEHKLSTIETDIAKFTELKAALNRELEVQRERIEDLEARANRPGKTTLEKKQTEYSSTFEDWVRARGQSAEHEVKMQQIAKDLRELKDITIGTPSAGGYAVPEQIAREVERQEKLFSPVRSDVKVVQVGTSDYKELVNLRGTTGGWVGETGSRSATNTSTLREVVPTHGELYAYPQVSEWSLDDIFFNVQDWLTEEIAETFAIEEATSTVSGNGTSQHTGMLNTTPTLIADFGSPLRAAAVYQYIASAVSPVGVNPDNLFDLVYALNSRYRMMAKWIFNSATAGAIRKLKDNDNQYLWQPGLQAGEPDRLLGYPTSIWEQLPDIGADNFPVGFGNWRRAYVIADRTSMRITRDEVTNPGFVRFYVRRRQGGIVLNNNAAKFLRTT